MSTQCEDVQKKLPDFLNDLLKEDSRTEMRDHLGICKACQDHVLRLSSFTTDLKLLAQGRIPFDLSTTVITQLQSKKIEPDRRSFSIFVWVMVTALVTAGFFIFFSPLKKTPNSDQFPSKSENVPTSETEQLHALQQLEAINSQLEKMTAPQKKEGKTSGQIALSPLHWDLRIENPEAKDFLRSQLKRLPMNFDYESEETMVFRTSKEILREVMNILKTSAGVTSDLPLINVDQLPETSTPGQVSLFFRTPGSLPKEMHWHAKFELRNHYILHERLKELGFPFLYDSDELWILQLSPDQLEVLRKELRLFPGFILRDQDSESIVADNGGIRVSLHAE